jgi:multidrug transporter EmrE-like cation transporter
VEGVFIQTGSERDLIMNKYLPLIMIGVLLNAAAQIVLKEGMRTIGTFAFSLKNIVPIGIQAGLNPFILLGIGFYGISVIVWLMVLSRVDVSYAYPMLSVGYIVAALAGKFFFGEPVNMLRWAGIITICIGVFMITRTA